MKNKAVLFPTVFAILMAIMSIGIPLPGTMSGTPWAIASHAQLINATNEYVKVDNIAYFLWGFQYTVVGKTIQSTFVPYYPLEDFPMFSMYAIIIAVISGIMAIILSRKAEIVIRGREIKFNPSVNPLTLLMASALLMIFAVLYLYFSANSTIIPDLRSNNYDVEYSYGLQFMATSVVAFLTSVIMTYTSSLSRKPQKKDEEDIENYGKSDIKEGITTDKDKAKGEIGDKAKGEIEDKDKYKDEYDDDDE